MDGSSLETMQARLPPGVPSFQLIADCEYQLYFQSPMTARSPFLEEVFPCECRFREGRAMMHSGIPNESDEDCPDPETQACGERSNCINRTLSIECFAEDCPCGVHCRNQRYAVSGVILSIVCGKVSATSVCRCGGVRDAGKGVWAAVSPGSRQVCRLRCFTTYCAR